MKIGILGAGNIAGILANTMNQMPEAELYAVASRDLARAREFAGKYNVEKAYGSYEELLSDPEVKLVYIATPHSHHYECMKMCIEHGKHVLCEKAFTVNASQAKEIAKLAKERGVFVTEAIWPRYMPSRKIIDDALAEGIIGKVCMMTANLWYDIDGNERIVRPELAGGALLDVGVYAINFALMHIGNDIELVESSVRMTESGVDGMETITVFYKNGIMASLTAGIYGRSDRKGIFYGDKGYLVVENINNPNAVRAYDTGDNLIKEYEIPSQISGYEYEIAEAIRMIEEGRTESESMPLENTIELMKIMDIIREDWGMKYPCE